VKQSQTIVLETEINPFAPPQVIDSAAAGSEDEFRLSRPIVLEGRGSLETAVRAVRDTYGLKTRFRFWFWLSLLASAFVYAIVLNWTSWVIAVLATAVAFTIHAGLIVPSRIVRGLQQSSANFDLLYRGKVTDASLELLKQTGDGEWVAVFPDESIVAWRELRLLRVGPDYLLFFRRREKLGWLLSIPRQFFATQRDWSDMVEFAERKLALPFAAPHCAKCKRPYARSELRPMPLALRLLVGQPFSCLGALLGVSSPAFCAGCWQTVYGRQVAALVSIAAITLSLIALFAFLALQ
jgi:hypothetical protein